jgi:VanZ family protein
MRPLKHLQLYFGLGGAYIGTVIWLTLTSAPPQGPLFENADKWEHLLAYGLMMAWFGQLTQQRRTRANFAMAFMALGGLLELLQGLGGVRQMELADAVANILGVWMGHWVTRDAGGRLLATLESKLPGARR